MGPQVLPVKGTTRSDYRSTYAGISSNHYAKEPHVSSSFAVAKTVPPLSIEGRVAMMTYNGLLWVV